MHEADFKWNAVESFADVTAAVAARTGDPDEPDARARWWPTSSTTSPQTSSRRSSRWGHVSNMVFMFQRGGAATHPRRSRAGDYRPVVRVHYYSEPYYIRPVTAACFDPPPNVESCLIGFKPRRSGLLPLRGTVKQFFTFVQACFAQKRRCSKITSRRCATTKPSSRRSSAWDDTTRPARRSSRWRVRRLNQLCSRERTRARRWQIPRGEEGTARG